MLKERGSFDRSPIRKVKLFDALPFSQVRLVFTEIGAFYTVDSFKRSIEVSVASLPFVYPVTLLKRRKTHECTVPFKYITKELESDIVNEYYWFVECWCSHELRSHYTHCNL